jgi:hypothetical protein
LTLGGQTLLADTTSIEVPLDAETEETTTLGDVWKEFTAGLLGGGQVKHTLFYNNTVTTGSYAYLTGKLIAKAAVALVISDGVRTITGDVLVTNVTWPIPIADMMKLTATYQQTGAQTPS